MTVERAGILKVWHFVCAQVVLFITILTFMFSFGTWSLAQLQKSFYPRVSGERLERAMEKLNVNLERQNEILTDFRIYVARNLRAGDTVFMTATTPKEKDH